MYIESFSHSEAYSYLTAARPCPNITKPANRPHTQRQILFCIELLGMPGAGKTTCSKLIPQCFPEYAVSFHNNDSVEQEGITDKIRFNQRIAEMLKGKAAEVGTDKLVVFDRGLTDEKLWLMLHNQQEHDEARKAEYQHLQDTLPRLPDHISLYRFIFMQSEMRSIIRRALPRHEADRWAITDECLRHLHNLYSQLIQQLNGDKHTIIIQSDALSLRELKTQFCYYLREIARREGYDKGALKRQQGTQFAGSLIQEPFSC